MNNMIYMLLGFETGLSCVKTLESNFVSLLAAKNVAKRAQNNYTCHILLFQVTLRM